MQRISDTSISACVSDIVRQDFEKCVSNTVIFSDHLGYKVYDQAIILPTSDDMWPMKGGLRDKYDNWVEDAVAWYNEDTTPINKNCVAYRNENVIYLGSLTSIYGHTFTDDISKVWYILLHKEKLNKIRVVYSAYWKDNVIPNHLLAFFELLGLDFREFENVKQITRFKSVEIPEKAFVRHRDNNGYCRIHTVMNDVYNLIINNSVNKNQLDMVFPKKIYLTRTKLNVNGYRDFGEEKLEQVFMEEGFTIIRPENYSIDEQISLMQHCEVLASTEGSISHNSIFLNKSAKQIVLKKGDWLNRYQVGLSMLRGNETVFITAHHSTPLNKSKTPHAGPFYMCITQELEDFLERKLKISNIWCDPSWWYYYFFRSQKFLISLARSSFVVKLRKLRS